MFFFFSLINNEKKNDDDTLNSIKAIIEEIFPPEEARNLNSSKIIQSISENVDAQLVEIVQASIKVAQKTSTINKHLSITSLKRGMELVRNEYKNVKKEAPISFVGETTRLIQVTHNNKYAKMFYLSGNDVNLNSEANNFNSFPPLEPIFDIHWLAGKDGRTTGSFFFVFVQHLTKLTWMNELNA